MFKPLGIIALLALCSGYHSYSQNIPEMTPPTVTVPSGYIAPASTAKVSKPAIYDPNVNSQQRNTQNVMREVEQHQALQKQQAQEMRQVREDIAMMRSTASHTLPSWSKMPGTENYRAAFDRIISDSISVREKTFLIENAYFDNRLNKAEFDKTIRNCGQFIMAALKEKGFKASSNSAKNFMLFQFFSESLQLKATGRKHMPYSYDFEDYSGIKDYSKMFVTKLLKTGSGQCHSMPLLYLILAEQIGAEAYLALSPNHSYIRFPDDAGKWYNIELTNGMFSTTSYILQSGYIKAEALQNKIYMQSLSKDELIAHQLTDLAEGYIKKYGYDEFVQKVISKALELYPNSINANMVKANLDTVRFEHVALSLGINPRDNEQLQKIANYPEVVKLLNEVNAQYDVIDALGFSDMPDEAYQKWLSDMKEEKQKQDNETIQKQFKGLLKPDNKLKG